MFEDNDKVNRALDRVYQIEHVDDYLDLCAGGGCIDSIEVSEEVYDAVGNLSEFYLKTRRQVISMLVNNYLDRLEV